LLFLLQNAHALKLEESEKEILKRKDASNTKDDQLQVAFKQRRLTDFGKQTVSQSTVNKLVQDYIVAEMCPLRTVETSSFIALITGLCPTASVMSRKSLAVNIKVEYEKMFSTIKTRLSTVNYVCTTADIGSSNNRSFLEMTVTGSI